MASLSLREIEREDAAALERARAFARGDVLARALLHASLEQPVLLAHSRHWCAEHDGHVVGVAAQIDGVFAYRSVPLAAALPGAAAALLQRPERPFACLAPEPSWPEIERAGARRTRAYMQMVRLRRDPIPDPDPGVKGIDDREELRPLLGESFSEVRLQLGPYLGVRGDDGRLAAVGGAEFVTERLAQLAHVYTRDEARRRGYARAIVVELVRALETAERRVSLLVRLENEAAVELYAKLGFRGARRFARLELGA